MDDSNVSSSYSIGKIYHFDQNYRYSVPKYGNLYLYETGELYAEAGFPIAPHEQWCYEITYIVSGSVQVCVDGHTFHAGAGDLYVCGRNSMHSMVADKNERICFRYIGFDIAHKNIPQNLLERITKFNNSTNGAVADTQGIGEILKQLAIECSGDGADKSDVISHYMELIILLTHRCLNPQVKEQMIAQKEAGSVGAIIYHTVRYVEQHLNEIEFAGKIAEELHYSSSYLSTLFHERMGITLHQFIIYKKMTRAVDMLTKEGYSVTDTAEALGYKCLRSFSRIFKKVHGFSPTEYIKAAKVKEDNP